MITRGRVAVRGLRCWAGAFLVDDQQVRSSASLRLPPRPPGRYHEPLRVRTRAPILDERDGLDLLERTAPHSSSAASRGLVSEVETHVQQNGAGTPPGTVEQHFGSCGERGSQRVRRLRPCSRRSSQGV